VRIPGRLAEAARPSAQVILTGQAHHAPAAAGPAAGAFEAAGEPAAAGGGGGVVVAVNGAAGPEVHARAPPHVHHQQPCVAGPRPGPARPETAVARGEPAAAEQVLQIMSAEQEGARPRGGGRACPRAAPRPSAARAGGGARRAAPAARVLRVPVLHLPQGAHAAGAGAAGAQLPRLPAGARPARALASCLGPCPGLGLGLGHAPATRGSPRGGRGR